MLQKPETPKVPTYTISVDFLAIPNSVFAPSTPRLFQTHNGYNEHFPHVKDYA